MSLGRQRVGSSPESDVRLPVEGVSRQHALILVTPEGLSVEDRGSKNGTFVDGQPVERHALAAGTRVSFGSVELEVEQVDASDLELAVWVHAGLDDPESETTLPPPSEETASLGGRFDGPAPEIWLTLLDGFAERLLTNAGADPSGALAYLNQALGLEGSCLLKRRGHDDALILAAQGQIGEIPSMSWQAFQTLPELTATFLHGSRGESWSLVLWGDFPNRSSSAVFCRLLLRYLARIEERLDRVDAAASARARSASSELVFPEGYVPGISPAMVALYGQMRDLPDRDLPVLIVGETGVGKEYLVSILHRSSVRRDGPQVSINCAAIPADLLESELFGIHKGVATGVDARPGKFQQAEGGTLFLDEVGEMPQLLQAKLLRALQEKQVQPVGGKPRSVDVRIVAATNADLEERMDQGELRRDLYYRLAGLVLEVPPLRQRPEDLPLLVEHFLRVFADEAGVRLRGMTVKAMRCLAAYSWPGNVRELRHELHRLVYACEDGGVVDAALLSARFSALDGGAPDGDTPVGEEALEHTDNLLLEPRCRDLERRLIREALRRSEGLRVQAARLLGISRNGLADKVKRLGIEVGEFRK